MMNVDGPRYIYTLEEMYAIEKVVNSTRISTEVLIHNFKQGKPSRANNSEGGPYGEDHALKDRGSQRSHSRHGARHVGRNGDVNVRRTRAHRDHETFELGMQYEEECQKKEQLAARKEAQASLTNTRQRMHPGPTDGLSLKQDIQSRIAGMSIPCVATKNDSTNCNQGAKSESATAKVNVTPTPANEVDAMFMGNFDDILSDNNLWSGLLSDSSNSKINVTTGGTGSLLSVVRVTEPHRSEDRGGEKNIPTAISHTDSKNQNRAPNNTNIVEVLTSALQKGAEDTSTYLPKGHSLASDRKAGNNVVVEGVPFTSRSATAVEWNTNTTAVSGEGRRKHSSRPMGDTSTMYTNNQQVGSLPSTSHNRSQPNRNGSAQSGGAGRIHRGNRNAHKYTEAPAGTGTKPNHNSSNQCVGVTKETRGNNASALDTDSRSQKNSNHGSNYGSASTGIERSGRADSVFTQLDNHITITSNTHSHGQAITLSSQGKGFNVSSLQSLLKKN